MRILILHCHLRLTGVSTWIYTVSKELKNLGIEIDLFVTPVDNEVFNEVLLEKFKEIFSNIYFDIPKDNYDEIWYNYHPDAARFFRRSGALKKFFVHGLMDVNYQVPYDFNGKVYVFGERAYNFVNYDNKILIRNYIDTDRYVPTSINNKLEKILILDSRTNGFTSSLILEAANEIGVYVSTLGINRISTTPRWEVEEYINKADLVIAYGRSAIEGMASGKPVIIFGINGGDGYLTSYNYQTFMITNMSGWSTQILKRPHECEVEKIIIELNKYNPDDGVFNRKIAEEEFSIKKNINKLIG